MSHKTGSASLGHQLAAPNPTWSVLDWAPDGSSFLAGIDYDHGTTLYWFHATDTAAGEIERVVLLTTPLSSVTWSAIPLEPNLTVAIWGKVCREPTPVRTRTGERLRCTASNLTVEQDPLTASLRMKRQVVTRRHNELITALYAEEECRELYVTVICRGETASTSRRNRRVERTQSHQQNRIHAQAPHQTPHPRCRSAMLARVWRMRPESDTNGTGKPVANATRNTRKRLRRETVLTVIVLQAQARQQMTVTSECLSSHLTAVHVQDDRY